MTDHNTDQDAKTDGAVEPKPFATFLIEHAKGKSHDELSKRLRDLLEAIENTGKGGTITYKLSIKPEPRADHVVVVGQQDAQLRFHGGALPRPARWVW